LILPLTIDIVVNFDELGDSCKMNRVLTLLCRQDWHKPAMPSSLSYLTNARLTIWAGKKTGQSRCSWWLGLAVFPNALETRISMAIIQTQETPC